MKVLVVCSGNSGYLNPFISDQINSLKQKKIEIESFLIEGKGVSGYLKNLPDLKRKIKSFEPNVIHAHYGLSGLLSILQTKVPVVITFHGSDINIKKNRFFSRIASYFSAANIFVSSKLYDLMPSSNEYIIPCGIDKHIFYPRKKETARIELGFGQKEKYILFSSAFERPVKNYKLAKQSISLIDEDIQLIELKGYSRSEVAQLMNAVDICLLTSYSEGSPQFIKEAIACNCPVVSVDVGSVKEIINGVQNSFICENNPYDISEKIKKILLDGKRSNGSNFVDNFDNNKIANNIYNIYTKIRIK